MHIIKLLIRAAVAQKSSARAWKMKSLCRSQSSEKVMWAFWKFANQLLLECALGKGWARFRMQRRRRHQWRGVWHYAREFACVSAPEINHPFFRHYYASRVALSLFRRLSVRALYFIEVKRMMVFTPPKAAIHQTAERCHARYHPSTAPRQYIFHGAF